MVPCPTCSSHKELRKNTQPASRPARPQHQPSGTRFPYLSSAQTLSCRITRKVPRFGLRPLSSAKGLLPTTTESAFASKRHPQTNLSDSVVSSSTSTQTPLPMTFCEKRGDHPPCARRHPGTRSPFFYIHYRTPRCFNTSGAEVARFNICTTVRASPSISD